MVILLVANTHAPCHQRPQLCPEQLGEAGPSFWQALLGDKYDPAAEEAALMEEAARQQAALAMLGKGRRERKKVLLGGFVRCYVLYGVGYACLSQFCVAVVVFMRETFRARGCGKARVGRRHGWGTAG